MGKAIGCFVPLDKGGEMDYVPQKTNRFIRGHASTPPQSGRVRAVDFKSKTTQKEQRRVRWADQQHSNRYSGDHRYGNLMGREAFVNLYHFDNDRSGKLLGSDTHTHQSSMKIRANVFLVIAMLLDLALLAWPITAIIVWGIVEAIFTILFFVHLVKAFFLFIEIVRFNTPIHKMFGRKEYGTISGIWTRVTHVKSSTPLFLYGLTYGWVQIPLMCFYIILSVASYPLMTTTFYWISWPLGIVSIVVGYVAWCFIVSEMAIRKQLEPYIFGQHSQHHHYHRGDEQFSV